MHGCGLGPLALRERQIRALKAYGTLARAVPPHMAGKYFLRIVSAKDPHVRGGHSSRDPNAGLETLWQLWS